MNLKKICLGCMKEKVQEKGKCPYCGFDPDMYEYNHRWLPLEHILAGKYLLGKVIGEGGFGITYIGWDLNMEVRVAIKEYFPIGLASREVRGTNQYTISPLTGERRQNYRNGLEKFASEAKNLARFYHLEGIVAVKEFFFENETAYMVMEYVDGITLREYLKEKGGRLSVEETLRIFQPVVRSLEVVHKENIIHRDISPDNIMITRTGESKLIDFGAARMACNDQTHTFTIILKHGYAPPEQYQTKGNQGPWTDVYAVCATMYRVITGQLPPNAMDRLSKDELRSFEEIGVSVPAGMTDTVIRKGMALQIADRCPGMEELYDALYLKKEQKITGTRQSKSKNGILIAVLIVGVTVAVLFGITRNQTANDTESERVTEKQIETEKQTEAERQTERQTETEKQTETERQTEQQTETKEQPETDYIKIEKGDWYYITCSYEEGIAVRKEPSDESELLCRIPMGTEFYVDTFNGTWGYTTVNGVTGWVEMQYAESTRNRNWTPDQQVDTDRSDIDNWYYITSKYEAGIAVRILPDGESELLTRIPYGTEFYVETTYNNWGYTTVNGSTGWIELSYADHLSNKDETTDEMMETGWYDIVSTYSKGIAVRSEPTGESELLTRIPYGTRFYVETTDGNWGYTTVNGATGWIELTYAAKVPDDMIAVG